MRPTLCTSSRGTRPRAARPRCHSAGRRSRARPPSGLVPAQTTTKFPRRVGGDGGVSLGTRACTSSRGTRLPGCSRRCRSAGRRCRVPTHPGRCSPMTTTKFRRVRGGYGGCVWKDRREGVDAELCSPASCRRCRSAGRRCPSVWFVLAIAHQDDDEVPGRSRPISARPQTPPWPELLVLCAPVVYVLIWNSDPTG